MPPEFLSTDELRRIERATIAHLASRRPGPARSSAIPDSVRADIGRYLFLECAETIWRLVREVRRLQEALQGRTPSGGTGGRS